jgi:hypothetical protein
MLVPPYQARRQQLLRALSRRIIHYLYVIALILSIQSARVVFVLKLRKTILHAACSENKNADNRPFCNTTDYIQKSLSLIVFVIFQSTLCLSAIFVWALTRHYKLHWLRNHSATVQLLFRWRVNHSATDALPQLNSSSTAVLLFHSCITLSPINYSVTVKLLCYWSTTLLLLYYFHQSTTLSQLNYSDTGQLLCYCRITAASRLLCHNSTTLPQFNNSATVQLFFYRSTALLQFNRSSTFQLLSHWSTTPPQLNYSYRSTTPLPVKYSCTV